MNESLYDPAYYDEVGDWARRSAGAVVPILLDLLDPRPSSVVDVGCGTGEWLAAFHAAGVGEGVGVDGAWVPEGALEIPSSQFVEVDLASDPGALLHLGRRFDLVVSLEVAEHLPPVSAGPFVRALAGLGDLILFSAAVPGQGGRDHQNEQWPSYWADLFAQHGFSAVDALRPRLWEEPQVAWWYRQNMFLFANTAGRNRYPSLRSCEACVPLALIHPERFEMSQEHLANFREWVEWFKRRESDLERTIAGLEGRADELARWGEGLRQEVRALRALEPGSVSLRRVLVSLPSLIRHAIRQRLGI